MMSLCRRRPKPMSDDLVNVTHFGGGVLEKAYITSPKRYLRHLNCAPAAKSRRLDGNFPRRRRFAGGEMPNFAPDPATRLGDGYRNPKDIVAGAVNDSDGPERPGMTAKLGRSGAARCIIDSTFSIRPARSST